MEKQKMTVETLRGLGRNWATGRDNFTMLPNGVYQLGVIIPKEAEIPDNDGVLRKVPFAEMEVEGHGTITLNRLFANQVQSPKPTLAKNGKTYYFPQKPVNEIFTGDLAVVAVELQGKKVKLINVTAEQQSGFPEKGKPWTSEEEALKGGKLITKQVYKVVEVFADDSTVKVM